MDSANTRKNVSGLDRRQVLQLIGLTGTMLFGSPILFSKQALAQDEISLPKLPYAQNALEPYISARTIEFHYGKHHAGYVKKANAQLLEMALPPQPLEQLIRMSAKDSHKQSLFNNVAQVWNHTFYWNSMKPGGGGEPQGKLLEKITDSFGSMDQFRKSFAEAATGKFGSGYAWLVLEGSKIKIISTTNAGTPLTMGLKPLLTIDIWEHAYYLDYQNKRGEYIDNFLNYLVNWEFVSSNLA